MKPKNISCVILARKGSKSVPNKNMTRIAGRTLIQIAIDNAVNSEIFENIYVSTDSDEMAAEALRCGAKVHHRDPSTAIDTASSTYALQEFALKHPEVDIIGQIQCTCPFVKGEYLAEGYRKMIEEDLDCVFSVVRSDKRRYDQEGKPLNFKSAKGCNVPSEYLETGMFYFATNELLRGGLLQGGKSGFVEVSRGDCVDIDQPFDVLVAEAIMSNRQSKHEEQIIAIH